MPFEKAANDLERSGISPEQAERAGMYPVESARDIYEDFHRLPAIVIPYLDPITGDALTFVRDGKELPFARVRYLAEPPKRRGQRKAQRYGQPLKSGVHPYFPVVDGADWKTVFEDTSIPICITEGEKKALASCLAGVPTVGLGGVFNFMNEGDLLPALRDIDWKGRTAFLAFDSDAATNPMIMTAEARLADHLSKLGAEVHVVRLPDGKNGAKQGIDDYLVAYGPEVYHATMFETQRLSTVDLEVAKLNEHIMWVEQEGKALELKSNIYYSRENLRSGSIYSSRKLIVPNAKGGSPKEIGVAEKWLTHHGANRVSRTVFDPASDERVLVEGTDTLVYNQWDGWCPEEGSVEPFLKLNEHVFQNLPDDLQDFALKLMAYKFQNPHVKIAIAIVLIGTQGSGKSMWAKIIKAAAGEYGVDVPSEALVSDFNGWLERALVAVIDEAKPEYVNRGGASLNRLISEEGMLLNEKYRVAKQVKQYAQFILTSNERRVGSYASDDRRMFVVNCPDPHPKGKDFYTDIADWWNNRGGAGKVCNYLINYDLKGWTPPTRAPLTDEKIMAREENSSPVERLAYEMQTADENLVKMWIDNALASAKLAEMSQDSHQAARGREVTDALNRIQLRPFYTPDELAMLFPMMVEQLYSNKRMQNTPAGEISRQLRECGVKTLRNTDDPQGFKRNGRYHRYLVIADMMGLPMEMSQNKFDQLMDTMFQSYREMKNA